MPKITKRNILLIIIVLLILVVIALLIGNFTFSYLGANVSSLVNSRAETTASGDTVIFSKGNDLNLVATTDNFNSNSSNLSDTTNPSVRLIASEKTKEANYSYYVGIKIKSNTYKYSKGTTTDIILTVRDENGDIVTSSDDDKLSYVTVTDKDGNQVSGFDITEKTGAFNIVVDKTISTASSTFGTTHTWTFTITFVNHTYDQSVNENASLDIDVILQKDEINFSLLDVCSSLDTISECIIKFYNVVGEGNYDLYYHDGQGTYTNANQEAGDNSYRYAGANPNNYVCFGSDVTPCPVDNLYRIIGAFDEDKNGLYNIKLIKADYVDSELLGVNGRDYYGTYISFWGVLNNYKGNMPKENIAAYRWNNDPINENIGINNWTTSELNAINLNTNFINYLNNIDVKWSNMISETIWYLGGNDSDDGTAKTFYLSERNNPGFEDTPTEYIAKVGLLYASDYGYAIAPEYWTVNLHNYDTLANLKTNWLYLGLFEWLITPIISSESNLFYIHEQGGISNGYASNIFTVRPVFYLNDNVTLVEGEGTYINPYRIA